MDKAKLDVNDLVQAIEYLGGRFCSSDTIETYSKSAIHKLVYNEILNYSKEELESCTATGKFGYNIIQLTMSIKNPYILSAFLKKGAFVAQLDKKSQWLLKSVKEPSNEIFTTIHYIEDAKFRHNYNAKNELHEWIFDTYIKGLNTPEQLEVLNKYLHQYGKKNLNKIAEYVAKKGSDDHTLNDYLIAYLKKENFNFEKTSYLNDYLPYDNIYSHSKERKLFISSTELPKIQRLLQYGYRFDEKKYSYNNDNLFIAIVKSERKDLVDLILPYLSDINPKKGTMEEQNAYIKSINETYPNTYRWIQNLYQKALLEQQLETKKEAKKMKAKL